MTASARNTALPSASVDLLMPMNVHLAPDGTIRHIGPTLAKLVASDVACGADFFKHFDVRRPARVKTVAHLRAAAGTSLRLRLRKAPATSFIGVAVPQADDGGLLVNLSFGLSVRDVLQDTALTSQDFAPTDLTVEILYLWEAQAVAMAEWRKLTERLEGAKATAEAQALTDTLTGLCNRRGLEATFARLTEQQTPFALMLIDLDYFKQINDSFGHAAGDDVLRDVAEILKSATRDHDTVARIGGDEFVILFDRLTQNDVIADVAKRIHGLLEEAVAKSGALAPISASIGSTASSLYPEPDLATMMRDADAALYASKREGRARHTTVEAANQAR